MIYGSSVDKRPKQEQTVPTIEYASTIRVCIIYPTRSSSGFGRKHERKTNRNVL